MHVTTFYECIFTEYKRWDNLVALERTHLTGRGLNGLRHLWLRERFKSFCWTPVISQETLTLSFRLFLLNQQLNQGNTHAQQKN